MTQQGRSERGLRIWNTQVQIRTGQSRPRTSQRTGPLLDCRPLRRPRYCIVQNTRQGKSCSHIPDANKLPFITNKSALTTCSRTHNYKAGLIKSTDNLKMDQFLLSRILRLVGWTISTSCPCTLSYTGEYQCGLTLRVSKTMRGVAGKYL